MTPSFKTYPCQNAAHGLKIVENHRKLKLKKMIQSWTKYEKESQEIGWKIDKNR